MTGDEGREGREGRREEAFLVMWPRRLSALNPPLGGGNFGDESFYYIIDNFPSYLPDNHR